MWTKSGEWKWVLSRGSAITRDANGRALRLIGTQQDITERKQMEAEIREMARFPAEDPNPVLRLDSHGTVVSANESSKELLQSWSSRIGQVAPKYWCDLVTEVLHTGQSRDIDLELNERSYTFLAKPIIEAGYVNFYGRDITKRKQAEEGLRRSEAMYRRLFESSQEGIAILDEETGKIIDTNPFLQRLSGYSNEQLVGKQLWEIESFKNIGREHIDFKKPREGGHIRVAPLPIGTKEKGSISVELVSSVFEHDGRRLIQCNIRDVTEQLSLQKALKTQQQA
jgi:PAS domain S-box-containing protein